MTAPETALSAKKPLQSQREMGAKSARWTLVLLKSNGETRVLSAYKWLALCAGLIMVALGAVGYGLTIAAGTRVQTRELMDQLTTEQLQGTLLRKTNADLSARVLRAENQARTLSEALETARNPPPEPPTRPIVTVTPPQVADQTVTEPAVADTTPETVAAPPQSPDPTVAVSDFSMDTPSSGGRINGRFRISNKMGRRTPASGYIFVVLEPVYPDSGQTPSYPENSFANGKPVDLKKGRYFSISKFKIIKFRITPPPGIDPQQLTNAGVYIYKADGTLLGKQIFALRQPEKISLR